MDGGRRPPAIVVGGAANALSIARSLGALGVEVHGLGVQAGVNYSRFVRPIRLPEHDDVERALATFLLGPASDHLRGAVLIAASDAGVTVLARHRHLLLERFRLVESDVDAQLAMLDKLSTYERAREAGVPTPRFWRLDEPGDLARYQRELTFPLIVKPLSSHRYQARFPEWGKFRIAHDRDEIRLVHGQLAEAGIPALLMEQIPGPDSLLCSYYTYLDSAGNPAFDFTKRVLRRYPPGMGLGCYHVTDWNPEVRDVALRLFKHVGIRGLVNAEFKRDERDGLLKLIECTARFTDATPLVAAAGFDMARYVYFRVLGQPHEMPARYTTGLRLLYPFDDLATFRVRRASGELSLGGWIRSLAHRHTLPFLRWDDPAPALVRGGKRTAAYLRAHLGRLVHRRHG